MSEKEVIVGGYHYRYTDGQWVVGAVGTGNATPTTWPHTVAMLERIHELEARAEARVTEAIQLSQDDETITVSVMPVTEAEAIAALTRKGWRMQTSPLGSFRFLFAPDDAALTGAASDA